MSRQFIACKFRESDTRSYTYHFDGAETFQPGDQVKVEDRSGDGWKRVWVVSTSDRAPSFPTKPILGRVDPEPSAEQPEAERPGAYHAGMIDDDLDGDVVQF